MKSERSALVFFLWVLALAVPLWLASGRLGVIGPLRIPVSDLALGFTPMAVALGLRVWSGGWRAAAGLVARAFDVAALRDPRWIAAVILIPPVLYLSSWGAPRLFGFDDPLLTPSLARLAALFVLFLALAAGEEIGWMGYAFAPLRRRWGALGGSLVLALAWWAGHLPSMAAVGASWADMAWWLLGAIALRIIMTWLYAATGASLFAMVLFHALLNLSRIAVFPATGAHYVSAYQVASHVMAAVFALGVLGMTRERLGEARSTS
ncbi:CPBP family intramembrane glutamic endopeptidase [Caulobacter segnis]|uniref:CPBP family intramembrane glutamic endopeptidase n=1 Tax=Caulobacter segnis TaxID=88688 RepID=UPI001CBE7FCA|nr:CPBP family intramembrane glutamic endopeptidase [Caulobacter segnis]UAL10431.1 CPBP family intramembrane metalloprotease [Caulobacter segnis]